MYKVFLSYAHADLDRASGIFRHLTDLGQTVWMDEAPATGSGPSGFVGIPAGQRHLDTITEAIADSATFLVCSSDQWRASSYCQQEAAIAAELGKRVAFLSPEPGSDDERGAWSDADLPGLVAFLEEKVEVALAQVRLIEAAREPSAQSWWARLFSSPRGLDDARRLLSAEPGPDVPHPTGEQLEFAAALEAEQLSRQRQRRRVGTAIIAVMASLAVVAVLFGVSAANDATRAEASRVHAESLLLAQRSLTASLPDSATLADQALALESNPDSRSAVAVARSATKSLDRIRVPGVSQPTQLLVSESGRYVVSQGSELVVYDPGLDSRVIELDPAVGRQSLVGSGDWVISLSRSSSGDGELVRVNVTEGVQYPDSLSGVSAFAELEGTIWLAMADGRIGTYQPADDSFSDVATLNQQTTALAVTADRVITLTEDERVVVFQRSGTSLTEQGSVDLASLQASAPISAPGPDLSPEDSSATLVWDSHYSRNTGLDSIRVCGDTTHILIGAIRTGVLNYPGAIHLALDESGSPITPFLLVTGSISYACTVGGDLVAAGVGISSTITFRAGQTAPSELVTLDERFGTSAVASTAAGEVVAINDLGEARILPPTGSTKRELGTVSFIAAVGDRLLAQDIDGTLYTIAGSSAAAKMASLSTPLNWTVGRSGTTIAGDGSTMVLLSEQGVSRQWDLGVAPSAYAVSTDASEAVVLLDQEIVRIRLDGSSSLTLPPLILPATVEITDLALDEDSLFVLTSDAKVRRIDQETGETLAAWQGPTGGRILLEVRPGPETGVVAHAGDGFVRLLDEDLQVLGSRFLGDPGPTIQSSPETGMVLSTTTTGTAFILDAETLELRHNSSFDSLQQPFLSGDGKQVVIYQLYLRRTGNLRVDMLALRREITATGEYQPLPEEQADYPASIIVEPVCLSCSP